jgi:hypothetical protein
MRAIDFHCLIAFGCTLVGAGCDPGPRAVIEKTVPAAGVLTWQGEPLEHYMITFYPKDGKRPAVARTDKEGRFTLGTNDANDGAVPGEHVVTVVYVGPEVHQEPGNEEARTILPPKVTIPEKYADVKSSDITIEVPAQGSADLDIELPKT